MKRSLPTALALLAIGVLTYASVVFSRSSDADSAARAGVVSAVVAPGQPLPPAGACALGFKEHTELYMITLSGQCEGVLSATTTCTDNEDALTTTVHQRVNDANDFYLTFVIPGVTPELADEAETEAEGADSHGAGVHDDGMVFAQVVGASSSRWSNRQAHLEVGDKGQLHFKEPVILHAEPGTPTQGELTLTGDLRC